MKQVNIFHRGRAVLHVYYSESIKNLLDSGGLHSVGVPPLPPHPPFRRVDSSAGVYAP